MWILYKVTKFNGRKQKLGTRFANYFSLIKTTMFVIKASIEKTDYSKLFLCVLLDLMGYFSYAIPLIGEFLDVLWAPISAILLMSLFKGKSGKIGGMVEFVEELLPFTDFVPTFTLTWFYNHLKATKKGL